MKRRNSFNGGLLLFGIICSFVIVSYSVLPVLWHDTCKIKHLQHEVQEDEDKLIQVRKKIARYKEQVQELVHDDYHYERIAREELLMGLSQETIYLCS